MGKDKLSRFAEIKSFRHVIEPQTKEVLNTSYKLKGKWNSDFFRTQQAIILELGCGKGEYSVNLGKQYPNSNFLGVDIKGARLWRGAKDVFEQGINNVGFLRTRIEWIDSFFDKDEISEIWITFPDPQLKKRRTKKRLSSPLFLNRYRKFLHPDGFVHLKTDSKELYDYTLEMLEYNNAEIIEKTDDLYASDLKNPVLSIKTFYEEKFLAENKKITYLKFKLLNDKDFVNLPE